MIPEDFDWWLLIGDETALPSIGRRIEAGKNHVPMISIVAISDSAERQVFNTMADHLGFWVNRSPNEATDPEPLMSVLSGLTLPPGDGFVWVAAEARVARSVKHYIINHVRHPASWLRASGYWVKGNADTYDKLEDHTR
jgi:NADPH-dependent ferric siderophore reductase